ncbi:MAG: NAD(P)-dependent oxidoreductase [Methylobacterium sp.]|jgi:UDP-glucose 4-epimerase|nr:NAD(P)-dependent oxidoreductase [Methylobacterium sp.]MCA3602353.1 NAD(P)-dependent oxidoreductase [Methylobacterium sp.]MCA3610942.1 NAD(P)-dependent oxidoreductase [Methylobacterium sp.]MCA3613929.1 NAD(P)-dependent oxidoreductase [Methylobacterium sp.]MCA3622554.1 NAD(P)-dependent oxidoreductase [Methylobacterium sp.]
MSVLVTGASGFVGAHVVEELIAAGYRGIVAADLESPPASVLAAWHGGDVRLVTLDVSDPKAVGALMVSIKPEFVVHAAAVTPDLEEEARDFASIVAVNAGGTANVLDAAARVGTVQRAIVFSSSAVYNGMSHYPDPLRENSSLVHAPTTLYAVTKFACEGLANRMVATGRLSVAAIRVCSAYGPLERATASRRAPRTSLIYRLTLATISGASVRVSKADAGRDWVHGSDIGRAVAGLLAASTLDHVVYNVSSGQAIRFRELVRLFREEGLQAVDVEDNFEIGVSPEENRPAIANAQLVGQTGFQPRIAVPEGIRMLIAYHRQGRAA